MLEFLDLVYWCFVWVGALGFGVVLFVACASVWDAVLELIEE